MKRLTATLCLTIVLLFGIAAVSRSADFQKGQTAHKSSNYVTTVHEWKPLVEQGDANAQTILGVMHAQEQGVPQEDETTAQWFTLAAEWGHGSVLKKVKNLQKKIAEQKKIAKQNKLRELQELAKQGNAVAQYNLGTMYRDGRGVPQDYKIAKSWFRLGAEQGQVNAQTSLGAMYGDGRGVILDDVYAHMWSNIAASSGDKNAVKNRDIFGKRMTPSQLEKAQDLARECVRKKYRGC